jgi:hypothetical protein
MGEAIGVWHLAFGIWHLAFGIWLDCTAADRYVEYTIGDQYENAMKTGQIGLS